MAALPDTTGGSHRLKSSGRLPPALCHRARRIGPAPFTPGSPGDGSFLLLGFLGHLAHSLQAEVNRLLEGVGGLAGHKFTLGHQYGDHSLFVHRRLRLDHGEFDLNGGYIGEMTLEAFGFFVDESDKFL